jgi:ATP/maltotriose-dependent transcriptional regulator MalT
MVSTNYQKLMLPSLHVNQCDTSKRRSLYRKVGLPFKRVWKATLIPNAHFVALSSKNHLLLETEPAWQRLLSEIQHFVQPNTTLFTPEPTINTLQSINLQTHSTRIELTQALTEREQEILELIAQGFSNNQIGVKLVISSKTVKNHITHIFSKMQVSTRAEAIVQARNAGLG